MTTNNNAQKIMAVKNAIDPKTITQTMLNTFMIEMNELGVACNIKYNADMERYITSLTFTLYDDADDVALEIEFGNTVSVDGVDDEEIADVVLRAIHNDLHAKIADARLELDEAKNAKYKNEIWEICDTIPEIIDTITNDTLKQACDAVANYVNIENELALTADIANSTYKLAIETKHGNHYEIERNFNCEHTANGAKYFVYDLKRDAYEWDEDAFAREQVAVDYTGTLETLADDCYEIKKILLDMRKRLNTMLDYEE